MGPYSLTKSWLSARSFHHMDLAEVPRGGNELLDARRFGSGHGGGDGGWSDLRPRRCSFMS